MRTKLVQDIIGGDPSAETTLLALDEALEQEAIVDCLVTAYTDPDYARDPKPLMHLRQRHPGGTCLQETHLSPDEVGQLSSGAKGATPTPSQRGDTAPSPKRTCRSGPWKAEGCGYTAMSVVCVSPCSPVGAEALPGLVGQLGPNAHKGGSTLPKFLPRWTKPRVRLARDSLQLADALRQRADSAAKAQRSEQAEASAERPFRFLDARLRSMLCAESGPSCGGAATSRAGASLSTAVTCIKAGPQHGFVKLACTDRSR